MDKKEEFIHLKLAGCLICEREFKPDDNWTKPLFKVMDLFPAQVIVDIPDMRTGALKQTYKNIYLCKYHYEEINNKIDKVKGGEIHV